MKNFYIFRHGQTDWNKERRMMGKRNDIPLNEIGLTQAAELAAVLAPFPIEIIYSSPLKRALETANVIAAARGGVKVEVEQDLIEIDVGKYGGCTSSDIPPEIFNGRLSKDFRWPGGESNFELETRVMDALKRIAKTDAQTVGIAAHAGILSNILRLFDVFILPHKIPNTAFFKLTHDGNSFKLDRNQLWLEKKS
jgi:broad specificity phosphatase PhoE